jgi:hypothetical protein
VVNRFWLYISLILLAWVGISAPKPVESIPVLANGQNVSCEQCHNAPPNLNAYGRYILATNFAKVLDAHAQMQENERDPVSLIVSANGSNPPVPMLPQTYLGLAQLNSAGYLGQDVTYYASVPLVEGGFPAQAVDQLGARITGSLAATEAYNSASSRRPYSLHGLASRSRWPATRSRRCRSG